MNVQTKWRGIELDVLVYCDRLIEEKQDIMEMEEARTESGDDLLDFISESAEKDLFTHVAGVIRGEWP